MRLLAYPAAALLLIASASAAYASVGLPKLATFQTSGYQTNVYSDSTVPHLGTNVITVEIFNLPEGARAELRLVSPSGQAMAVPLNPLTVLTGPEGGHGEASEEPDAHGSDADSHGAPAAADAHGAEADSHDSASESDGHGGETHEAAGFNARGKVKLNQLGTWTAVLKIVGVPEGELTAEASFEVERGGPNRIYLGFTGLLMGGTIIYGAINRRTNATNGR